MKIKKFENFYYKIFYEIIPEDKIQNSFINKKIYNDKNNYNSTDDIGKTNENNKNNNEKITDMTFSTLPTFETNGGKIEIEIRVIKKSCIVRYKRKISNCFSKCWDGFKKCLKITCKIFFCFFCFCIYLGYCL